MKKIIEIPAYGNDFYIHVSDPLISGDTNSYEIAMNFKEDVTGSQFVVQAKRADEVVVTDSALINGKQAKYMLKNNMYSVPGEVHIRLQVVQNGEVLTTKQCVFNVEEGYISNIDGDDRIPALSSLISQSQAAASKANAAAAAAEEAAKRVPDDIPKNVVGEAPTDGNTYGRKNGAWAIVELPENVPTITMAEADDFFDGVAIVEEVDEVLSSEISGKRCFNKYLLVCSNDYDLYDFGDGMGLVQDSDRRYTQILLCPDGSIKKRQHGADTMFEWSDWATVSATAEYVDEKIGDVETSLENIIDKYGLGGDA